jgi:hypothetical protein
LPSGTNNERRRAAANPPEKIKKGRAKKTMKKQLFRITGTAQEVAEAMRNLARLYPKGATVAEAI